MFVQNFLARAQAVIASDGKASFVIIHYEIPERFSNITLRKELMGFSPGQSNIMENVASITVVESRRVFRIDGKAVVKKGNKKGRERAGYQ